jgi:hypothetical protein
MTERFIVIPNVIWKIDIWNHHFEYEVPKDLDSFCSGAAEVTDHLIKGPCLKSNIRRPSYFEYECVDRNSTSDCSVSPPGNDGSSGVYTGSDDFYSREEWKYEDPVQEKEYTDSWVGMGV